MKLRNALPLVLAFGLCAAGCRANGEPFEFPMLPTRANDAGTVERGTLELEIGGAITLGESATLPLVGKVGLAERTELFLPAAPLLATAGDTEHGVDDFGLGLRQRLVDEGERVPALALQATGSLSSARPGLGFGSRDADLALAAVATKTFDGAGLIAFHEFGWVGDGDERVHEHLTALAGALDVAERTAVFGELALDWRSPHRDWAGSAVLGATYAVRDGLTLQVGVAVELGPAEPRTTLTVGLTGVLAHALGGP